MNQKIIRKISLFLILTMIIGIFQGREVFAAPKKGYKLYSTKLKEIDVYKENKKPAGRNYNLTWDSSIFYNVEGLSGKKGVLILKDYKVSRKVLKNKKTGNRMEYEVYKHPKTGIIHKIVSIEYRKKDLELTDYYYTNDGKPNFIFQRRDSIYTPTYADTNKTGERYYFNSDNMITWRWVDKPYDVKERTTKKHQSEAKPQYLYTDASESEKKAYDKREVRMLNAAYNTLAAMKEKNEHGRLQGYVTDTKGKPVKGAKVEIYVEGKRIGELTTNQKGLYETGITRNKKGYDLKISAKGLKTVEVKGVKIGETDEVILIKVVILVKTEKKENAVNLNIFDAEATKAGKKGYQKKQVGDAKIFIRKGMDNKKGKTVLEAKGDKKGRVNLKLPNGVYTLEIIRKGYITVYQTLVVEGNEKVSLPLVKKPKKKGMKIVLNWKGKADLDSILFTPKKGEKGDMAYVGAGKKKEGKTKLVLDGKAGYTTEVIVIEDAKNGNFKYYVSDYTKAKKKQFTSKDLKKLKLLVYVYDENGLVEVFTLPFDVNGIVWEVFEVKNGKVLPLQKTYNNVKGKKWWTKEKREGKKELVSALKSIGKDLSKVKVGISIYKFDDNFMTLYRTELEKYLVEDLGLKKENVTLQDGKGDQAEQTNQIKNFITDGVDVMILNLVQASSAPTITDLAKEANIPVVYIDREPDAAEEGRWAAEGIKATYVGVDAKQSGTYQGEEIVDLPNKGDINGDGKVSYIMIQGDPENVEAQYRTEFSVKALKDAGMEVEELLLQRGDWMQDKGQQIAQDALTQFGDKIEVIFCNNDDMALGAIQAINAAGRTVGKDIYITGVDALTECCQLVADGKMTGTVFNDFFRQAHAAADKALDFVKGKPVDPVYMIDHVKVTKKNALKVLKKLRKYIW